MQHDNVKKYLFDILDAIAAIETAKKQVNSYQEFYLNRIIRSAIERELITIGAAATIIRKKFPDILISNIREIAATRNIIVHDYDGVNYKVVWSIIDKHLLTLKEEVTILINH